MTIAKGDREENHRDAFGLMMRELGDRAIDTTLFDSYQPPFSGTILRTTWEELVRAECVGRIGVSQYRLTAKGWLVGLELSGISQSQGYMERVGGLLATMKRHVKGRKDSAIIELHQLALECGEPEGWLFNVIDSRASSSMGSGRTGARWFRAESGRLVEIPVDFNMEPIDIAAALTVGHLEKIQALEERIDDIETDRAQFHCPYCDAPTSGMGGEDFPNHYCYVTYQHFACGYVTADGFEEVPCPYGPHWPELEEFDFMTKQDGDMWVCYSLAKTDRARRVHIFRQVGRTKEEAEERARRAAAPKTK